MASMSIVQHHRAASAKIERLGFLALKSDETLRQRYRQKGLTAAGRYDQKELALRMLGEIRQCVP